MQGHHSAISTRRGAPRLARIFVLLALVAAMSAIGLSGAFACVTCDSSRNCHAGDEQGGYLCFTGQMTCSLIYKLLGGGCEGNFCRTMEICLLYAASNGPR